MQYASAAEAKSSAAADLGNRLSKLRESLDQTRSSIAGAEEKICGSIPRAVRQSKSEAQIGLGGFLGNLASALDDLEALAHDIGESSERLHRSF